MSIQVLVPLLLLSLAFGGAVSYDEHIASKTARLSNQLYSVSKEDLSLQRCPSCYEGLEVRKLIVANKILSIVALDH